MKKTKKVIVPESVSEEQVAIICDVCGDESPASYCWAKGSYESKEVEVVYVSRSGPIGYGSSDILSFDLCPNCFCDKLVPFLESLGAKPNKSSIDY